MDADIKRILSFWFDGSDFMRWFQQSEDFDKEIQANFGHLVTKARASEFDHWTQTSDGTLALLLLLDQFPRNLYRGSGESFASDAKAREVAVLAIAKGFDHKTQLIRQPFFYLPLMHDETLIGQIAGKGMFLECSRRCQSDEEAANFLRTGIDLAERHIDVILQFGRFPARNQALGRASTTGELDFLKKNPSGF